MIDLIARAITSRSLRPDRRPVVDAVDFAAHAGRLTVIVGPSGAGKSTLLDILTGVATPARGTVTVGGRTMHPARSGPRARLRATLLAPARQSDDLIDALSVEDNVALGQRLARTRDRATIERTLAGLAIADVRSTSVADLSGGERRRVALARALASGTAGLVCDEPTNALDERAAVLVRQALRGTADAGRMVLAVTHDPSLAVLADRVVRLRHGVIEVMVDGASGDVVRDLMVPAP